jgi:hypothetical protein
VVTGTPTRIGIVTPIAIELPTLYGSIQFIEAARSAGARQLPSAMTPIALVQASIRAASVSSQPRRLGDGGCENERGAVRLAIRPARREHADHSLQQMYRPHAEEAVQQGLVEALGGLGWLRCNCVSRGPAHGGKSTQPCYAVSPGNAPPRWAILPVVEGLPIGDDAVVPDPVADLVVSVETLTPLRRAGFERALDRAGIRAADPGAHAAIALRTSDDPSTDAPVEISVSADTVTLAMRSSVGESTWHALGQVIAELLATA